MSDAKPYTEEEWMQSGGPNSDRVTATVRALAQAQRELEDERKEAAAWRAREELEAAREALAKKDRAIDMALREFEAQDEACRRQIGAPSGLSDVIGTLHGALSTHAPKMERTFTEAQVLSAFHRYGQRPSKQMFAQILDEVSRE